MLRKTGRGEWGFWRAAVAAGLWVLSTSLAGLSPDVAQARSPVDPGPVATISATQRPPQGRDMMRLIYQGGPVRYDKDGTVFGNRERILPANNRGYYREYTVRTPGEQSRGARRIICGGLKPTTPDACYYTDNHYASFRKITP